MSYMSDCMQLCTSARNLCSLHAKSEKSVGLTHLISETLSISMCMRTDHVKEPHVVQDLGEGDQENWLRDPKV